MRFSPRVTRTAFSDCMECTPESQATFRDRGGLHGERSGLFVHGPSQESILFFLTHRTPKLINYTLPSPQAQAPGLWDESPESISRFGQRKPPSCAFTGTPRSAGDKHEGLGTTDCFNKNQPPSSMLRLVSNALPLVNL